MTDNVTVYTLWISNIYVICGNGADKIKNYTDIPNNATLFPFNSTSSSLCSLAQEGYSKNSFESLDHFEPLYLKPPNVTKPKSQFKVWETICISLLLILMTDNVEVYTLSICSICVIFCK